MDDGVSLEYEELFEGAEALKLRFKNLDCKQSARNSQLKSDLNEGLLSTDCPAQIVPYLYWIINIGLYAIVV